MTDYERTRQLFRSLNIGSIEVHQGPYVYVQCHNGKNNITGQYNFYTEFKFTKDGKFVTMGAWE